MTHRRGAVRAPEARRARCGGSGSSIAVAEHSLLIAAALAFLAPVVFIALTALMTNDQALSPELWPEPFEWRNFAEVFHKSPLLRWT